MIRKFAVGLSLMCAVAALMWLLPGVSAADDLKPKESGWIQKSDEGEFRTYVRDSKGEGTREVLMMGIMDAFPAELFSIVGDYEHFPDFMPYIHFTKLVHSETISDDKTANYVFFYLSPPMVSYRFYTLELNDERNPEGKKGWFRSKWTLEKGQYRKTPSDPEISDQIKRGRSEPVETAFNEGYWLFEPWENGTKTRITYYVWTNPGGSIPLWIANKANTVALPELWSALKKRLATIRGSAGTMEAGSE